VATDMGKGGTETGYERLGERKLTLTDAVAQSAGFMAPVFSSALLIPLIAGLNNAGKGAGVATPFAVILAAIGIFALGWIVAAYARRIHAAGSLYDYVTEGFGDRIGFVAGLVYYVGTAGLTAGVPLLFGGLTQDFLRTEFDVGIAYWVISLAYAGVLFFLLYLGVRISTRTQLVLVAVSILVVFVFFLSVIIRGGDGGNSVKPFLPGESADGWSGIFFGVLYGVLIFVGFETAANLGEETAEPGRSIPRAIYLAVGLVTVYYVIAAYAQVIGFGLDVERFLASPAPLFELGAPEEAGGFGSVWIGRLLQIVVLLDIAAVGVGAAVSTSRGFFALGRDRRIPGILAKVSPGYGTPSVAISVTVLASVLAILAARSFDGVFPYIIPEAQYFQLFVWLATFGGFALVVVYATLALGAFRGLRAYHHPVMVTITSIIGFVVSAGAIYGSIFQQTEDGLRLVGYPLNLVFWITLALIVLGFLLAFAVRGRERASSVLTDLREPPPMG
jgi:amino acid transporter